MNFGWVSYSDKYAFGGQTNTYLAWEPKLPQRKKKNKKNLSFGNCTISETPVPQYVAVSPESPHHLDRIAFFFVIQFFFFMQKKSFGLPPAPSRANEKKKK